MNQPIPSEEMLDDAALRIVQRCELVGAMSDVASETTRTFCSPAMKTVHSELAKWMQAASLSVELDAVGNLIGLPARQDDSDKPILMIGSHLDTVVAAGKFDGVLGVMLGLAVAELIHQTQIQLPFDVAVVGFSEEEGVRFNRPYLGSSGIAGTFDPAFLSLKDPTGVSVEDALNSFGCDGAKWSTASFAKLDAKPGGAQLTTKRRVIGFLEAHIEQGPLLESEAQPVGIVSAIAGQTRAVIVVRGTAGHAGTVPHHLRSDALAAAAELVSRLETLGQETDGLVATVGKLDVRPNAPNVIPGEVTFSVDIRHADDSVRKTSFKTFRESVAQLATNRNIEFEITTHLDQAAVPMDTRLNRAMATAIQNSGHTLQTMLSGAGHDAAIMAQLAPAAMLFIRCRNGISHHPDEHVESEDILVALTVMLNAVLMLESQQPN